LSKEGADLNLELAKQMNNNRLSSNNKNLNKDKKN
jgi:hypothetical protein